MVLSTFSHLNTVSIRRQLIQSSLRSVPPLGLCNTTAIDATYLPSLCAHLVPGHTAGPHFMFPSREAHVNACGIVVPVQR